MGVHRFPKWLEPLHEGRIRGSQGGMKDFVDLRRLDLNHQL
jgi:hypothetical protein